MPLFLSYNESYLVYTTGIGEDVILDYIDIINNKKDAPDSFQNAVKINKFIGAFFMYRKTNLFIVFLILLLSIITTFLDQKASFFNNLSSLLFLQFIFSISVNIFLLKYIFDFEFIRRLLDKINILFQYFIYTIILFLAMFMIMSIDLTNINLLNLIFSLLFLFVFSFLTQLLICETISKVYIRNKTSIYFSALAMFILFMLLIIPNYLQ